MRIHLFNLGLVVLLSISICSGCGPVDSKKTEPKPKDTSENNGKPGDETPVKVELRTVDVDAYNAELAKHKGKVVFVDFWATWCPPCKAEFPHTVELHSKYAAQGFAAISVSVDEEGDEQAVREFLTEQKAVFANLRSEYGSGPESAEKIKFDGAVPHYKLYDRSGKLVETWDGKPDKIEEKIEALLKEPA